MYIDRRSMNKVWRFRIVGVDKQRNRVDITGWLSAPDLVTFAKGMEAMTSVGSFKAWS